MHALFKTDVSVRFGKIAPINEQIKAEWREFKVIPGLASSRLWKLPGFSRIVKGSRHVMNLETSEHVIFRKSIIDLESKIN